MAKQYGVFKIDGKEYPVIASVTGGDSQPVTRDVPAVNIQGKGVRPGSTIREQTGAWDYTPILITFMERTEQNYLLDDIHAEMLEWQRSPASAENHRRACSLTFFRDDALTVATRTRNWIGVWPFRVSPLEYDIASRDARGFEMECDHQGDEYITG